jgi:hypothetical protein
LEEFTDQANGFAKLKIRPGSELKGRDQSRLSVTCICRACIHSHHNKYIYVSLWYQSIDPINGITDLEC